MATFVIILILIILFFGGIIWKIFSSTKEKIKKNDGDHNHENDTHNIQNNNNHGHDDHGHTPPSKKMSIWGKIWNIIGVAFVIFLCTMIFLGYKSCQREKEESSSSTEPDVTINPNEDPSKITYPLYGKQVISEENPAKAGLKPGISSFQILDNGEGKAILWLESDPGQFIICDQKADGNSREAQEMINKWKTQLPWGNYIIEPYPKGSAPIPISWKEGP